MIALFFLFLLELHHAKVFKMFKKCLRKGFFAIVFPSAHLYLFHSFETGSDVLASLGVLLFVSGPSVPFPPLPRIS